MAPNLTGPARRAKAAIAYEKSVRRTSYTEIAEQIGTSRQLVSTLVKEEQGRVEEERDNEERDRAIATYDAVIRKAWEELADEGLAANSLNRSGYLNTIINAQKAIDAITGVQAPKEVRGSFTHEYIDLSGASEETIHEIEEYLATQDS